jgi:hypothetical protein
MTIKMKVGIVADNYKVPMFEKELTAAGFSFEKFPFTKDSTTIRVVFSKEDIDKLRALCARVQSKAFHNKQKEN